jgi:ferritin
MEKKLYNAFNDQIKNELYSGYLYLAMAAYFETENLPGFAHWMKLQAKEEVEHAMKLFEFLNDVGERVVLQAIPQPQVKFSSAQDAFKVTLAHEQKVTSLINNLYNLASKVSDNAAKIFLQWFVTEQVEEEKHASEILTQLKMVKPDTAAMLMLDRALAQRAE